MMLAKQSLIFFLTLFLSTFLTAQQQTGSIRGKVTDAETSEPLIGANVFLKQTGQGTVTDLDGNFVLRDVPPGPYDVECTFLGYKKQRVVGVVVKEDGIKLVYFRLATGDEEMATDVIITADAARNLEVSMLAKRKNSEKLLETLSSEQIFQQGDEDVGAALKHLTNISVENNNDVYIRGLGSRYVKTLLNGAEVPGLDLNSSSVQLDLFPTSILDNITVYKNFTADQIGGFGGGYVEINTISFPERFTLEFQANIGAHSIASFNSNYTSYEGGSLDWLGIDDGTRMIPEDRPTIDIVDFRTEVLAANELTNRFPANFSTVQAAPATNSRISFMISNQTNLKRGRSLSYGAVLLYKNSYQMYEDGFAGLYQLQGNYNSAFTLQPELELSDKRYQQDVRTNALLNFAYKTRFSKVSLLLMNNLGTEKSYRVLDGIAPRLDTTVLGLSGNLPRFRTSAWLFDQKNVAGFQLTGTHLYKGAENRVNWQISTTRSDIFQPDLRYFSTGYTLNNATQQEENHITGASVGAEPTRFYRDIGAWNGDAHIDFIYNRKKKRVWKTIKWGLRGTAKYQIFDERQIAYDTRLVNYQGGAVDEYIQPDNYVNWDDNSGTAIPGLYVFSNYDSTNNYIALEGILGGYFMSEFELSRELKLTAGLRTEITANAFTSFDTDSMELQGTNIYPVLLPAVSMKYELEKDMFLRVAYASTVARPTLRELSAFTSFDYIGDYTVTGNLRLAQNPTVMHNLDFRWEVYPSKKEVVSAGAFFKYLQRPIELASRIDNPNASFQFQNLPYAYLMGIELELRQGLGILGDWGRNFVMGANLGYIYSQARISDEELAVMRLDNPEVKKHRPLFGQSPYVLNFLLNYNNEKIGLDVNASFHISGRKIIYVLYGNTPNVYEQPRGMLNFNITKHFNKRYHLRFSVENLLDAKMIQIQSFKGRTYSYRQHSLGRMIWLGFSYLIK
jgi:hypothetical protein